jgi:glutamine synthetase
MSLQNRSAARYQAVSAASARKTRKFQRPVRPDGSLTPVSEFFGCNTFGWELLSDLLSSQELAVLREPSPSKRRLTREIADKVASAAKNWALSKGATHYCHWFQPQTGATAEKHDAFFAFDRNGSPVESFTGKLLMQAEPDASSFPSGGRRSTFEARGYTAWDATSPMFLMESDNGTTLCIPSVFVSYSGESLDNKTPLLRSITVLSEAATTALHLIGDSDAKHVATTCGAEQEYFVIDRALYELRPDLVLSGRTLLGRIPPKHQQLEDHYFGSIKSRVLSFMMESETELFKLGVPCKTRHNEVAPSQCEAAPIFEFANIAADHNQLVMEVIRNIAKRHDLVALFHEKPYAGMNGSGKHLNWSMADNHGNNLLEPGDKPEQNIRFLYFLAAAIKGVHDWSELLRSSVASAGNDFRLGANEAPPAIMSVFLGETLTEVLERLGTGLSPSEKIKEINLDLARIPVISKDNTDRNRTSPFAFTGNKFEFRALGASQSVSMPATNLNTAVAAALTEMNEALSKKSKTPSQQQILEVVLDTYKACKRVCFEGNGYSSEWHKEAEKRGLPHLRNTPVALAPVKDPRTKKMFVEKGIFHSAEELDARYNVLIESYIKVRLIELETLQDMIATHVLPAATAQICVYRNSLLAAKEITGTQSSQQKKSFETLHAVTELLYAKQEKLTALIRRCGEISDHDQLAKVLGDEGMTMLSEIRDAANEIELLVDDQLWSLPKLREMIYTM